MLTYLSHSGDPLVYCLNPPTEAGPDTLGALAPPLICPWYEAYDGALIAATT